MEQRSEAKSRRSTASAPEFAVAKGLSTCSTHTSALEPKISRFDDLPDDVRFNILVKAPTKCLHRSNCVSKRWLLFISSPSFARSYMLTHVSDDDQHPDKKMLFVKIQHNGNYSIGQHGVVPLPPSLPCPDLDPFCFIPALRPDNYVLNDDLCPKGVTERVLKDIELQGVFGGLVLLQALFWDRTDTTQYYLNPIYFIYYVCNPVTKHWVELPQVPPISSHLHDFDFIGFTCYYPQQVEGEGLHSRIWVPSNSYDNSIEHIPDYDPNKVEFTVVHVNRDENNDVFIIRVFSSTDETDGWSIFHVLFPPGYRWVSYPKRGKVLFFNGMFHWCGDRCIVVYDPFNKPMQCDLIQWPPTYPLDSDFNRYMVLEACEGRLRLSNLFMYDRFMSRELVDYANKTWIKKCDVILNYCGLIFQSFVGGAARDKAYVILTIDSTICLLDVENGSLQDFYECPFNMGNADLVYLEPFMPSPWPTYVPLRHRN